MFFYSGMIHWCAYDDVVHKSQVIFTLGKEHSQRLGVERLPCPRLSKVGHWTLLRNVESIDGHFVLFCFVFRDRVSLCSPGYPETHPVDQAGLKLRDLSVYAATGIKGVHHHHHLVNSFIFLYVEETPCWLGNK